MTYLLLYISQIYVHSGGLNNFKLFFDICKKNGVKILYCPLLKDIPSLKFISAFNNVPFEEINQSEMYNYFNIDNAQKINNDDIVTVDILCKRDNVVIYSEDVIGNPAEQKHVVRWLHFFPIKNAVMNYDFENDLIYFFSDYIYNFYKYLCNNVGIIDNLTKNIKELNICRVFLFNKDYYENININRIDKRIMYENKSFTIRKFFYPFTFRDCDIRINYILKIKKDIIQICEDDDLSKNNLKKLKKNVIQLNTLINEDIKYDDVRENWKNKFLSNNYEEIGWKLSPTEYVNYFKKKSLFVTLDPFTFISIIAALTGCISVIKKIDGIDFDEWQKGDPFNKFGIAYGMDNIDHALRTRHLLLNHIQNMYLQNNNNVLNMINAIETKFLITIKDY